MDISIKNKNKSEPKSSDSGDDDVLPYWLSIALPLLTIYIGRRQAIVLAFSFNFRNQR